MKSRLKVIRHHLVTKTFSKKLDLCSISMTSSLARGSYITLQGQCSLVLDCRGKWRKKGNDGLIDGRIK